MPYAQLVRRIRQIITQALPGQTKVDVEKVAGNRPYLVVTSEAFDGKTLKERQDMVWQPLKQELGAEVTQISLIETYTPQEA